MRLTDKLIKTCKECTRRSLIFFLPAVVAGIMLSGTSARAFEDAYKRKTEYIYAVVRHGMTVYDEPSGEIIDYLPDFEGVVAVGEDGSWYEVRYKKKKKTHYGYVTKDEFRGSGLEYDGRDKQIIADGRYRLEMYSRNMEQAHSLNVFSDDVMNNSFLKNPSGTYTFTYVGNHAFHICSDSSGFYLGLSDSGDESSFTWTDEDHAGAFVLVRDDNVFRIVEQKSRKYLTLDQAGNLSLTEDFDNGYTAWRIMRTRKAVRKGTLRCFCQYDPDWAHFRYGKGKKKKVEHGNFSTSGCGALAFLNAVYSVSGQFPDLFEIGRYASYNGYRIEDAGTDSGFFKAAADHFGYKYGIAYDGSDDSFKSLRNRLASGDVAVVYLPGHYGAIVSYDPHRKKYLLLDPHKLPRRGTSEWGNWVSRKDLSSGELLAQSFYYFRRFDDPD